MKRILFAIALLLSVAVASNAQTQSGSITTNGSTCTNGVCVQLNVNNNINVVTIDITGTWTGTISFEFSADGGTTYRALSAFNIVSQASATSTTANGTFTTTNNNFTNVRARGSASMTGTANVIIRPSNNGSVTGINFGGGGSTIGTVNQGTASGSENWRVNCVSGCSGGTTDTDDGSIAAGQSTSIPATLNHVYNGSAWTRLTFGQTTMSASLPVTIASNQTAIPASQSGTWTVQPGNTANTTAWLVTGTGGTFPATQSGTWTVQPGNTANTTAWLVAGGKTNNNAAPGATNFGVLPCVATTTAPSYTTTNQVGCSTDLFGATRVLNMDSSGNVISPGISCNNVAVVDTAASGNTQLVALASSQTIYICSYALTAEATVDVKLVTGTGTACATGEASITGNYAFSTTTGMLGLARGSGLGMVTKGAVSSAVCLKTSGAVQINGEITYTQF